MDGVVGYEEFKNKMKMYLVNLAKDIRAGKKTEQTIYVLLGPPGIGKSYISEKVAEGMERPLINIDLGGRSDTGILEGVSPSVKAAYPGRLCSGISVSKNRGAVVLLDEFEKVRDEGLANIMGYRIDLSDCILLCTANYADQVPDFVQNRAEMVNIELATYQQRVGYVMNALKKKLRSDTDTSHYAEQLTEDFCYRQTNANIENVFKTLRGYCSEEINLAIENFTEFTNLEETANRWIFAYDGGQKISLVRVRTENEQEESVLSGGDENFMMKRKDLDGLKSIRLFLTEKVTQNYFGSQRLAQEKKQELLGKIKRKIQQEINNPNIEFEPEAQYEDEQGNIYGQRVGIVNQAPNLIKDTEHRLHYDFCGDLGIKRIEQQAFNSYQPQFHLFRIRPTTPTGGRYIGWAGKSEGGLKIPYNVALEPFDENTEAEERAG
ncbi:1075_t:CDS:2 [Entrophospora sp. SA101]|nr:1075_t:CDS:2 [Entrophospora sp. SA101]